MRDLTKQTARLERIAVFGGIYNNHLALEAVLEDARLAGAQRVFFLGDVGGFGPHPDRSVALLRESDVTAMRGNYDDSVGNALPDCQCGYNDPRDNYFARISYDYTLKRTSPGHREWLRDLPDGFRLELGGLRLLMAHGSPRRINEFLWESTTPEPFVRRLLRETDTDWILVTHTGIHWWRRLSDDPARGIINVGAIGRPANDGDTAVWYVLLTAPTSGGRGPEIAMRRVEYPHERLALEMVDEGLPPEFVETIRTGWWTTCLEILPAKERAASRF